MPFPHVERAVFVRRPALVIARWETGVVGALLWTMMVTNAERPDWIGDLDIPNAEALGLLIASKIRTAKVSTVEEKEAAAIGRLDPATLGRIREVVGVALKTA